MESLPLPFFVRDAVRVRLEKRIEALDKGYRQNIGLIGTPGLGKTHILNQVFTSFSSRPRFIPVYINADVLDLDQLVDCWTGALLSGVFLSQGVRPPYPLYSLMQAAAPIVPKTIEAIRFLKKNYRKEKGSTVLKELFTLTGLVSQETGKNVLFILDEFQALDRLASDPFTLIGKEIMIQKNTLYLAASSHPYKAREILREKLSLLFGNFEVVELSQMGFAETVHFVETRLPGKNFTGAQKRFLIRMTDGHPTYLELLLDQLNYQLAAPDENPLVWQPSGEGNVPDGALYESFSNELCGTRGRLSLLFSKKMEACLNLAKDGAPYAKALLAISLGRKKIVNIAAFIDKKSTETQKILQRLVVEDFITRRGAFYVMEDPLFRFWLCEVYQRGLQVYTPDSVRIQTGVAEALRREFEACARQEETDIAARVESLFKEFRNDVFEFEQKKLHCPQFSEITSRPASGRVFPVFAKSPKARWLCQIARETVREEDIVLFLEELKKSRKKVQQKILITLAGIEQNAKLMAQEAKIQLWNLRNFNKLLELYDQPKMILFSEKEEDGTALGALAKGIHSA